MSITRIVLLTEFNCTLAPGICAFFRQAPGDTLQIITHDIHFKCLPGRKKTAVRRSIKMIVQFAN